MFWQTKHAITRERSERTLKKWAKSRVRQSGNQLFLSSDCKYTRREPLTERLSLHIRAYARVLYYCLSACHKSNSRRNFGGLSAKIIKHDHVVLNAQRVEQVKHSLGHHRRTSSEVACKMKLAWRVWLAALLPLPKKSRTFWEPCLIGYLCGSSPMKKTVFDLLHSLDIKIQYIQ